MPAFNAYSDSHVELNDLSDFKALSSLDGYVSICGFGSLLSEKSARSTFSEVGNFRVGVLRGFRRLYAAVGSVFVQLGLANQETGEVSGLTVEPCDGETLIVTIFEIRLEEVPALIERENEYRFLAVVPEDFNGKPYGAPAVVCASYTDDEYFRIRCKGNKEILYNRCGKYNIHKIWRDDVLPCRVYLKHCVLAAKSLGKSAYDNFLDHTFLGDRKTTIRQYLSTKGAGIMEEAHPESRRSRYGG